MNRIQALFERKQGNILSFYCTAGFPGLQDTVAVLEALEAAGADMIEIGMPFSDPLADGTVIQESSTVALNNGMSLEELFRQLKTIRQKVKIPLLLMGYLNPVLQFGITHFCREAAACGIDGLIIPDLPLEEYQKEWKALTTELDLCMVFLLAPATSEERIRQIDTLSGGFIYVVTSAATTGKDMILDEATEAYFRRLQQMALRNPLIAGFGIRDRWSFEQVCQYTKGAVIGSSFISALRGEGKELKVAVHDFVRSFPTDPLQY